MADLVPPPMVPSARERAEQMQEDLVFHRRLTVVSAAAIAERAYLDGWDAALAAQQSTPEFNMPPTSHVPASPLLHGPHDYAGTPRCQNCGVEYDPLTTTTWCDKYPGGHQPQPGDAERLVAAIQSARATGADDWHRIPLRDAEILVEALVATQSALAESRAEVERLNKWADGFSDAQLKERRLCEELLREVRSERDEARAQLARLRTPTPTGEERGEQDWGNG